MMLGTWMVMLLDYPRLRPVFWVGWRFGQRV